MPASKHITPLPAFGSWPQAVHVWEQEQELAVVAALGAQRPLLIRGDPGTGKSQMARAAAVERGRLFVSEVVQARSESQDLLYRYDAVARLGEAQAMGAAKGDLQRLAHQNFLSPGPLWWVFDWDSALAQHAKYSGSLPPPEAPADWKPEQGAVLLIDEIDKADSDLPNGLLETLGNGAFSVPWLRAPIRQQVKTAPPLVVITTNEERELPAAFLRRCVVLNLDLPKTQSEFVEVLVERGLRHFDGQCDQDVCGEAAEQIWQDRDALKDSGRYRPGQAEYIDLLRVLASVHAQGSTRQRELLAKVKPFFVNKNRLDET